MKRHIISLTLVLSAFCLSQAQETRPVYKASDSVKVEQYLKEASHLPKSADKVLFFARKFMGLPYVAHTLEVSDNERLVVNLDELDCTTYVGDEQICQTTIKLALVDE